MKLENTVSYPARQVRAVVAFGVGDLASARWLTVRVHPVKAGARVDSDASGEGTVGPVLVRLGIEQPESFFPADYRPEKGYLPMSAQTWRERLVFLAAHEANHVRLQRAGHDADDTELRADRAGLARLRLYRLAHFFHLTKA